MEQEKLSGVTSRGEILILGIGNLLMGDEGIGVHLIRALEKEDLPDHIALLDGGTGGFHLMSHIEAYPRIVMVDATLDDQEPGAYRLLRPKFAKEFPRAMSTHDIGLKDLMDSLQVLEKLPEIYLFAVSIETIQPMSMELSAPVQAAIPPLIESIKGLIEQLSDKS